MRVALARHYGPPEGVRIEDHPSPAPAAGEVRVRVQAAPVTSGDARIRAQRLPRGFGLPGRLAFGLRRPRQPVLGSVLSGVVDAVGPGAGPWREGDAVVACTGLRQGAHAEAVCVRAAGVIVPRPPSLDAVSAAALPFAALTMRHYYQRAALRPGQRVLVVGAGGSVGAAAVQLAHHAGAEVVAACRDPDGRRAPRLRALGARSVRNTLAGPAAARGAGFDVLVDVADTVTPAQAQDWLRPGGRWLALTAPLGLLLAAPWVGVQRDLKVVVGAVTERRDDLRAVLALAVEGALKPVIDRVLPLEAIVDAHRRVDSGMKDGEIVLTMTA